MSNDRLPISVSWGAGVQSTAIALLVEQGRLPQPDVWVFADTGDEPDEVYEHIERWKGRINLEVVSVGPSLVERYFEGVDRGENPPQPPFWIADPQSPGKRMPMRRQCTERWKIRPIKKFLRERFDVQVRKGPQLTQWLGISVDEAHRMKPAQAGWYQIEWPLIDLGLHRTDCLKLIADAGESAPRSACRYCPFHSDDEWRRLRAMPGEWKKIVAIDRGLRQRWESGGRMSGQDSCPTLHRSGRPIDEIDFDAQQGLFGHWGNECAGHCGT